MNRLKARRRHQAFTALKVLGVLAVIAAILGVFFTGISNVQGGAEGEGRERLEESVRRTAAACYAAEGTYPPSLDYMKEKYGLQVDEDRYYVDYILVADNLMPDFTVVELDPEVEAAKDAQAQGSGGDVSGDAASADASGTAAGTGASGEAAGQGAS